MISTNTPKNTVVYAKTKYEGDVGCAIENFGLVSIMDIEGEKYGIVAQAFPLQDLFISVSEAYNAPPANRKLVVLSEGVV